MSNRIVPKITMLAVALAMSTAAMALNPQPEPPIYYHGYQYVISSLGNNGWSWEIRKRVDGRQSQVLSHGSIRGDHDRAMNAARGAIDHLAVSQTAH